MVMGRLRACASSLSAATAALAAEGYDPAYGARPLKRTIQERIENPLASRVLRGEIGEGDAVTVEFRAGGFLFVKARE